MTHRCPAPSCQVDVQRVPGGTIGQGLDAHYRMVHPDRNLHVDLAAAADRGDPT